MPLLPRLTSLWRNLFRKARNEQELAEKIDAYLEMLVEQKINEVFDPAEARRAALIELGGREQVKEKVRFFQSRVPGLLSDDGDASPRWTAVQCAGWSKGATSGDHQ